MSDLSQWVSEDSRRPIERLRRHTLHRFADAYGVDYPPQAPKDTMIQLLEAHGVDVTQPMPNIEVGWKRVDGQTADGVARTEMYPVEPEHGSARNGVNASLALDQKLTKEKEQNEQIEKQQAKIDRLEQENAELKELKSRLAQLEAKSESEEAPEDRPDPARMKYWDLVKYAKEQGIQVPRGTKKAEILEALNGQDAP